MASVPNSDLDLEKKAAWLAIRCAAAAGQAQRSRILLIGDSSVTGQPLSTKALEHMPDFISLDLISAYVLGERKKVYKSKYNGQHHGPDITLSVLLYHLIHI